MSDPFSTALDCLFGGPASVEAAYLAGGTGAGVAVRCVRGRPDEAIGFGDGQIIAATDIFELRRSEVAAPQAGDVIAIGAERFVIRGACQLDAEGLGWRCGADPE